MQSEKYCDMFYFEKIIFTLKFIMGSLIRNAFVAGDFVFAKMRFFAPWPAQVEETKKNYARVRFLADDNRW